MSEGGRGGVSERGGWGGVRERGGWSEWKGKEKVHYMYWCQLPPSSPLSHSFPSPTHFPLPSLALFYLSSLPPSSSSLPFLLIPLYSSFPLLPFSLSPPLPSYPSLFLLPPPPFLPLSPPSFLSLSIPPSPSSLPPPSNHSGRTEQQAWEANKDLYRSDMIVKRSFQTLILSCFAVYELDTPPLLPAIVWIKPHA